MKKITKIVIGIYLFIGLSFSIVGVATLTVLGKADTNIHYDQVYHII